MKASVQEELTKEVFETADELNSVRRNSEGDTQRKISSHSWLPTSLILTMEGFDDSILDEHDDTSEEDYPDESQMEEYDVMMTPPRKDLGPDPPLLVLWHSCALLARGDIKG